ncbi:hypothetical protein F7734_43190 [Scytonema sp. UIC 10036]|uniref:hypothetical protein n=1 Tax=Scytonema sp. UIC 10036 TaxID=2304196 RepID=UPI0012DAE9EC|nr:hypothetical protein [Scytonema sp. UIC 10036]MUG98739.1 hypothetical protein [Scytonema sp. UIC 10036]
MNQPIQAEIIPELPPEVVTESAEISATSLITYSSSELAQHFQTSDRTIRNWLKRVREIFYWCPDKLTAGTRYSQFCFDQLQAYKSTVVDGGKPYQNYRDEIWTIQAPAKQVNSGSAIVLSAHRDNTLADRKLTQSAEILDTTREAIKDAYQQQPTLAKGLAKLFAARFKQEFASEYATEIKQAVQEVLETTEFER